MDEQPLTVNTELEALPPGILDRVVEMLPRAGQDGEDLLRLGKVLYAVSLSKGLRMVGALPYGPEPSVLGRLSEDAVSRGHWRGPARGAVGRTARTWQKLAPVVQTTLGR
jgi:hypothetical protein